MTRFIRKLLGKSRREAEADACIQAHREVYGKQATEVRAKVRTIELLLSKIQKDVTAWH